jgi:exosortase C (VPDSG-CTERM-specific)
VSRAMKPASALMNDVPAPGSPAASRSYRLRVFGLFAASLGIVFAVPLWGLTSFVAHENYYSHILLIPLVSAYLIRRERLALAPGGKAAVFPGIAAGLVGFTGVAVAYLWFSTAHPSNFYALIVLSFLSLLLSGTFFLLGKDIVKALAFPVAFLVFAIPLPHALVERLQIWLQYGSAETAYWMLKAVGVPMLRDGINFRLPGILIQVAEECSGFNSSLVLFIVSFLAGRLFFKSARSKAAIVVAVIPLALLRNGFRITVISVLCVEVGPHMIHSPVHQRGGPLFFALSLIPFVGMIWALRRWERKSATAKK